MVWFAYLDCCGWLSGLYWRQKCPHLTAWKLVGSISLQDSMVGPEKSRQRAMAKRTAISLACWFCSWLTSAWLLCLHNCSLHGCCTGWSSSLFPPRHQHLWCYFLCRGTERRHTVIVLSVSQSVCLLRAFLVARWKLSAETSNTSRYQYLLGFVLILKLRSRVMAWYGFTPGSSP